jgi:hypothetical protein
VSRWIPRNPHQKEKQLHQTKLEEELMHQLDHLSMAQLRPIYDIQISNLFKPMVQITVMVKFFFSFALLLYFFPFLLQMAQKCLLNLINSQLTKNILYEQFID